jgi:hypothetical protein
MMDITETTDTALSAGAFAGIGVIYAERLFPEPAFSNLLKRALNFIRIFLSTEGPYVPLFVGEPTRKIAVVRMPDPRE